MNRALRGWYLLSGSVPASRVRAAGTLALQPRRVSRWNVFEFQDGGTHRMGLWPGKRWLGFCTCPEFRRAALRPRPDGSVTPCRHLVWLRRHLDEDEAATAGAS